MQYLKSALLGLILCLLTCCTAAWPPAQPPGAPRAAIATVLRYHAGMHYCSAIAVGPTLAITAAHCVSKGDAPVLEAAGEPARTVVRVTVVRGLDSALLGVEPAVPFRVWATPAPVPPRPGQRAWAVGYGCSLMRWVDARPLQYVGYDRDFEQDTYYGKACHGDSGGAVFDDAGHLVGQLTAIGLGPLVGVAFATPVRE